MPQSEPQSLLGSWRQWQVELTTPPEILRPLDDGKTNRNYVLRTAAGLAVLRIHNPKSPLLGIDREREFTIIETLAQAGLHPSFWYIDQQQGFSVRPWLPGEAFNAAALSSPNRQLLHDYLQQIATLNLSLPPFDYVGYLDHYWQEALQRNGADATMQQAWPGFRQQTLAWQQRIPRGLTHHDLAGNNCIVDGARLILIDWEYAAAGAPILDWLAAGRVIPGVSQADCDHARQLLIWLDRLWYCLRGPQEANIFD